MRKNKALLIIATFTTLSLFSQAQTTGKVTGKIEDDSKKIIEAPSVSLLRATDSAVVKIGMGDKAGRFEFENIQTGRYMVLTTAVGFAKNYTSAFDVSASKPNVQLEIITMLPADKSMAAVAVTARRPLVEQKVDRMVVNVDASPTNVGSSAMEVLEKSPGISVDKDGNISLKGKAGVMVLVDGRPTQLSGADLANMLRSMNASQLDQIEIMTNPPAKFDAAGNAGILNIKTKKTKQFGYNGALTLGYGHWRYPKFNESLTFNYRQGKINLFTTLSHNYRKSYESLDIQRKFYLGEPKMLDTYFDQQARMTNENNSLNAKVGMDYSASKNTSFGFVVGGLSNSGDFINNNNSFMYDENRSLINQTKALSVSSSIFKNFSTNLNFRQVLDTTGKELTADLDYLTYTSRDVMSLSNYYLNAAGNTIAKGDTLFGRLPQFIDIWSGKVDYLQPLKKGARFEAGLKTSIVTTDNDAVYDLMNNGNTNLDSARSNHFIYEENINAAYVNVSTPLSKKWNAQIGLRLENTIAMGTTTGYAFNTITNAFEESDTSFKRNYTQLFPTAYFQYAMNEKNNFGINYGRRIRRPNYESLNPFIEYLDRYTYQQGNPNLKPQFSHNIEVSHTYKNFLTTTLNHTRTNDIIQQVIDQNTERKETFIQTANIAKQRQYGIAVSMNKPINKWWTSSIYVNASHNRFEGLVNGAEVTVESPMLMLNGSQQFKVTKTFTAEVSGFYRTKGLEGVIQTSPMGMVNLGFSQQLLKGKGTLRLNVRDVLFTQQFKAVTQYGNVDAAFQSRRESRVVNVGFTYRFSKGKMNNTNKRRTGSANDEQNRVGGGTGN